jgi:MOSC domain-containing protein YiiM
VLTSGAIRTGDPIEIIGRPDHDVTVTVFFRATTTQRELLPRLLAAEAYLDPKTIDMARRGKLLLLD